MNIDEIKLKIAPYFEGVKTKDANGDTLYSVIVKPGFSFGPQGYWKSENEAIEMFYAYLVNNNRL